MGVRSMNVWLMVGVIAAGASSVVGVKGQDSVSVSASVTTDPPPVPKGVEVLARGPVHEAFATPTTDPVPTKPVPQKPPQPIEEMPPDEKPEGNVLWIGGYFHYDEDNKRFLWVSGVWRTPPPGKQWVAGYWRADGDQWLWVPGFWTEAPKEDAPAQEVTYLPAPPEPPKVAPEPQPAANTFYIPGCYVWRDDLGRYVWKAGFWTKIQPGYVWVAAHYRWSPSGYIYIPGYWDLALNRRGVLYAPVYVDTAVVGVSYVYTPAYAVPETVVVDAMFVRPCCCHYYYGDYYEVRYRDCGYTSCVVYSQTHYDSVMVYETTYVHREEPTWLSIQIDFGSRRERDPELRPASTSITNVNYNNYVVNNSVVNNYSSTTVNNSSTTIDKSSTTIDKRTTVNNTNFLMPAKQMASAKGVKTVKLDSTTRVQAREQAQAVQQVAVKRAQEEKPVPAGGLQKPVTKTVPVVRTQPVGTKTVGASGPDVKTDNTGRKDDGKGKVLDPIHKDDKGKIPDTIHKDDGKGKVVDPIHKDDKGKIPDPIRKDDGKGKVLDPIHKDDGKANTGNTVLPEKKPAPMGGITAPPGGTTVPRTGAQGPGGTVVPAGGRTTPPPPPPPPPKSDKDKDKDKDKKRKPDDR